MLNKNLQTIIIEKNEEDLKLARQILQQFSEIKIVGACTSAVKGMSLINNYAPDLVFVSTELPESDGLQFVDLIHQRNIKTEIIYLSNNGNRAYEALASRPFDYLVRPIELNDIEQLLIRLKEKLKRKSLLNKMKIFEKSNQVNLKRVFLQKGGIIVLPLEKILYCKAELTKTTLTLVSGEKIPLKTNITETIETLNSEDFIRTGRSYCVNRHFLRKIDRRGLKCHLFYNGNTWEIPASKTMIAHVEKINTAHM